MISETAAAVNPDTRLPGPRYWLVHTLSHIRPRQDDGVLTERNTLDLDERPLKIVPSKRSDSLRTTTEGTTFVTPELTRQLLPDKRRRTNPFSAGEPCGAAWPRNSRND